MKTNLLSERLDWCITNKWPDGVKYSQTCIAEIAGVSRSSVTFWMKDQNGMSTDSAIKLGEFFGVNYRWLELGEGSADVDEDASPLFSRSVKKEIDISDSQDHITIKRVDLKISAGITGYSVEYLNDHKAPIVFRKDWIDANHFEVDKLFAIKVSGQSMESSLYDGDLVVVNSGDAKLLDGAVYAVNYEGELVIKRMIRQGSEWILSSDNPDKRRYADKLCHENCLVIGKVVYKQSEKI